MKHRCRAAHRAVPGMAAVLWLTWNPAITRAQAPPPADTAIVGRFIAAVGELDPRLTELRTAHQAALARAAAAGPPPALIATVGASEVPGFNPSQGNLRLEIGRDLFTGSRQRAARAAAAGASEVAAVQVAFAERRTAAATLRELVRTAALLLIDARLLRQADLLGAAADGLRARFAVGDARYVDVLRLRTEQLRVQTARADAIAAQAGAVAALRRLTDGRWEALTDSAVRVTAAGLGEPRLSAWWRDIALREPTSDTVEAMALARRSADAAATASIARAQVRVAVLAPAVAAAVGLQRIGQANQGASFGPVVTVSTSLPFTRGASDARVRAAAEATAIAATASRAAVVAAARQQIATATARYLASRERVLLVEGALLQGARDEREAAVAAFRTGTLSLLELIDFERSLTQAEIERLKAIADAADARVALFAAVPEALVASEEETP